MPEDDDKNQNQNQNPDTNINTDTVDSDLKIPSIQEIEYSTPSAYIDPNLPANPAPIKDPNEPEEEKSEPEAKTLEMTSEQASEAAKVSNEVMASVTGKIADAKNIVVTVSSDPSIDELSAAISLSLYLERTGKHAVAIYSGDYPSVLQFLKPEDIFEKDADVMQDFVITLNKEKADHLRYKLDDDAVRIFITPYKDRIVSEDLSFSYGDYNVDLAIALNVNNGVDIDPALSEYGTILHDASIVNITTGNPGKFGEIEWSNKLASSVSEMVASLLLNSEGETKIDAEEATALLTGIVAATERFSRANTTSTTMQIASKLMDAGANQQLVAANISDDSDNQFFAFSDSDTKKDTKADTPVSLEPAPDDNAALAVSHQDDEPSIEAPTESKAPEEKEVPEQALEETPEVAPEETPEVKTEETEPEKTESSDLLNELKATEASLSDTSTTPTENSNTAPQDLATPVSPIENNSIPVPEPSVPAAPTEEFADATSKYSQMLTDALKEPTTSADSSNMTSSLPPVVNPAATNAPTVSAPEVSGIPEINYGQTTGDILPPPPAPPIDISSPMPVPPSGMPPVAPQSEPTPTASTDASAFTIPGM